MSEPLVLWVSRHNILLCQFKWLLGKLGKFQLRFVRGKVPTAEWLFENYIKGEIEKGRRVIVIPVLPLSIVARLVELANKYGFEVWWAEMEQLVVTSDVNEALRILRENEACRTITTYADGTVKVFEAKGFKRIKEVKLVLEDI